MAWYHNLLEKLNPAQGKIADGEGGGSGIGTDANITFIAAFDKIESVRRGTNIIVDAAAGLDYDVKDSVVDPVRVGMRQKQLIKLLNYRPNPYQSANEFRKQLFLDYILDGNAFVYFDGAFLYHLPAANMEVVPDKVTFVNKYIYDGETEFKPDEVMHFKDISNNSIYRGTSRLAAAQNTINGLYKMQSFQDNFFENGAVPGMVFTTENTLSQAAKEKTIQYWQQRYNPKTGARRPMIVDSGLKPVPMSNGNFREMDFDLTIKTGNVKILNALGVPQVLFDGGNNANISPNLRLFYLETVLPVTRAFTSSVERFFGFDIEPITANVSALQPELKDLAQYLTSLVNGGVITPNEARVELRYEKLDGQDDIRVPANIAGSAADPSQGGAPKKPKPQ